MTFRKEYTTQTVYPDKQNIYQAFDLTPFEDIKVVILGKILITVLIKHMV